MIFEFFSEKKKERIFEELFSLSMMVFKKGASLRCLLLWCAFFLCFCGGLRRREREKKREQERVS